MNLIRNIGLHHTRWIRIRYNIVNYLGSQFSSQKNEINNASRIKIQIDKNDLEIKQIKGGGPGGQATNKTSNCVVLTHKPSGITVKCHSSRDTETNKNLAIKRLKEKLDDEVNGSQSKKAVKAEKSRKQKACRDRKSKKKYSDNLKSSEPKEDIVT